MKLLTIAPDKLLHFAICFIVTFGGGLALKLCGVVCWLALAIAGGVALALGVAKEVKDRRWDWGDIVADVVGIGAGGGLAWLIGALL